MHFAINSIRSDTIPVTQEPTDQTDSKYAVDEIHAYIAIRDNLLAQAEIDVNGAILKRVRLANDLVESCLKTAGTPYQTQNLGETDATRERQRCKAVRNRVAELRAALREN
jgi:hypothetical protein